MPSRKKAKGKARKAVKEATKAKESQAAAAAAVSANNLLDESAGAPRTLAAQLQRLGINAASQYCKHGLDSLSSSDLEIGLKLVEKFVTAYDAAAINDLGGKLIEAHQTTKEEYADVYYSKLEAVISIFLCMGTRHILRGNNNAARFEAMLASFLVEWRDVYVWKTKAVIKWSKVVELDTADEHTLVSYYRKRVTCTCLDARYKEVEATKKMGSCYSRTCSVPKVERCKMLCCTRCGEANYCSIECQKTDWKHHRLDCDCIVERKAEFKSKQS